MFVSDRKPFSSPRLHSECNQQPAEANHITLSIWPSFFLFSFFLSCNFSLCSWRNWPCTNPEIHQLFNIRKLAHIIPLKLLQRLYLLEKPLAVGVRKCLVRAECCWGRRKRQTHTHTCDILPLAFLVLAFQWTKEGGRGCAREWEGRVLRGGWQEGVRSVMTGEKLTRQRSLW